MSAVTPETHQALASISVGRLETLEGSLGLREEYRAATGLDQRTLALVKVAALIALDAPPASFGWQVADAVDAGATAEDILGVLRAVAPQVARPGSSRPRPRSCWRLGSRCPTAATRKTGSTRCHR